MKPHETETLVQRVREGDTAAFAELYKATNKRIYALCIRFLKNRQDAEDVMQETYLSAFRHLPQLADARKFRSWLEQIAANQCRNFLKKKVPVPTEPQTLEELLTEEADMLFTDETDKRSVIMGILREELSELQYQTVLLYYFKQHSVSEIAEMMDCTENAVKNRLSTARSKIKAGVERYQNEQKDKLYSLLPFLGETTITERMGRSMLHTKILVGAGAVIIAAGGVGTLLHLQKNAPPRDNGGSYHMDISTETASAPETLTETAPPETIIVENPPAPVPDSTATLHEKGLEIIALMEEELHSEEWLGLYATSTLTESEAFVKMQSGDYSAPQKVYQAVLPEENVNLMTELMQAEEMSALSGSLGALMRSRLTKSWINVLNARMGAENVAAGSIISAEKVFVSSEAAENCIYIYTFENGCPVAVNFTVGEGGAVMASGQMILFEPFQTGSVEEVEASLTGIGALPDGFELFRVTEIG